MYGENGTKPKILHVDDDRFQQEMIALLLSKSNLKFQTCSNGQEAVALALEWLPNLILMDIMMPVMDGIEATKILRADPSTCHIPILGLTAVIDPETQAKAITAGMNNLLSKTIIPSRFLKQVQLYLKDKG